MAWRERMAAWLTRSEAPGAAAPAPAANGSGGSLSATLPPWGGQWPLWGYGGLSPENLSVVTACIDTIASALASLPAIVFERLPNGEKREARDHPVARVIAEPNRLQSWVDIVRAFMNDVLLYGNAVMAIARDGAGQPSELLPVPWFAVMPVLLPSASAGNPTAPYSRLRIDVAWTMAPFPLPQARPAAGTTVASYFPDAGECFFLRERSGNSQLGISRLARAAQVVQLSLNAQSFVATTFQSGATLSGVLQHPGRLSKETADRLAQSWADTHCGPWNASKTVVLEEGMSFEAQQMTLESAQLAATREFQATEICRLFQCPPSIIGIFDKTNFSTAEAAERFFATNCLTPWAVAIEQEFQRSIFLNDRFFLELDLAGLTRGTFAELAQTMISLTRAGLISANEGRHALGYDPVEDAAADRLVAQAIGGKPQGTADGQGDALPALNGGGRPNGAATMQ